MIVHKLIEHLTDSGYKDDLTALGTLHDAHKFKIVGKHFMDDSVQQYTQLLLESGLLRIPFRNCYFEVGRVRFEPDLPVATGCLWARDVPDISTVIVYAWLFSSEFGWSERAIGCWKYGSGKEGVYIRNSDDEDARSLSGAVSYILGYAIAFMDLKETKTEDVVIKDRVNKHRRMAGKTPFYSHKVLTITPSAREALRVKGEAAIIARRAHWRRGHLRHLPNKIVPVAPALVRGEGFISKDYRI